MATVGISRVSLCKISLILISKSLTLDQEVLVTKLLTMLFARKILDRIEGIVSSFLLSSTGHSIYHECYVANKRSLATLWC